MSAFANIPTCGLAAYPDLHAHLPAEWMDELT